MSQKITSKNLSYDSSLPPFLRNLHAQSGSASGDPITTGQRRSAKKRSGSEEAEDVPVVVDEEGNVVNVEVDKEGIVKEDAVIEGENEEGEEQKRTAKESETGKAAFGGRKRKVGRAIGEAAEEAEAASAKGGASAEGKTDAQTEDASKGKKPRKKAKKIKLSFDTEDG